MAAGKSALRMAGTGALALLALAGCKREEITEYTIPKETYSASAAAMPAGHPPQHAPIHWALPAGWKEVPASGMRVASFTVPGENGQSADVSIVPLPSSASDELTNVNRWRNELGLGPITAELVAASGQDVTVCDAQGRLFDIAGEQPDSQKQYVERTLAAMAEHGGQMWFFKMRGPDALVAGEKQRFIAFLNSIDFHADSAAHEPTTAANPSSNASSAGSGRLPGGSPQWQVPEGWEAEQPGMMVLVAFRAGGAQVTVSPPFGSDFGGLRANLNRWRGQVGLPPVAEADLPQQTAKLDLGGTEAIVADMTGKDLQNGGSARQIVVVVPQGGQTWFYKIKGDEASVSAQKEAFLAFIKSAKYP